ncbi:hypothetical protein [Virgibacillus sp. LDC-1]|uniref:tetratricopeptide repeat protein n=1 Tax=Virgibacillus sp. LDC-1 TaxID=3039856 RepID=UPI0024DE94C1|nr:hypothetical protein [Virgibacillus sp. LDC-1]
MQQTKNRVEASNKIIPFIPEGDFYYMKGVKAFQKRKFEIAIKWLTKAIEATPDEPLYKCQMSIIYTEIGSFHKANQLLTNVLQTSGDKYIDCYYLLANNYAHLGLLHDAKKYALSYLNLAPKGDFREEAEDLLYFIEIDEEQDDDWDVEDEDELIIYQESAFYYMETMDWDNAIATLEEMLHLFPEHKTTKHEYAHALFFAGYQEDAIQMEQAHLKEEPNALFPHANLALFFYEMNDISEYEKHKRALLNVYPIHEQQKLKIAVTFARTACYSEALQRFKLVDKGIVRSHISFYRWYSLTLYMTGFEEKAIALWEEGCKKHQLLLQEKFPWEVYV